MSHMSSEYLINLFSSLLTAVVNSSLCYSPNLLSIHTHKKREKEAKHNKQASRIRRSKLKGVAAEMFVLHTDDESTMFIYHHFKYTEQEKVRP